MVRSVAQRRVSNHGPRMQEPPQRPRASNRACSHVSHSRGAIAQLLGLNPATMPNDESWAEFSQDLTSGPLAAQLAANPALAPQGTLSLSGLNNLTLVLDYAFTPRG